MGDEPQLRYGDRPRDKNTRVPWQFPCPVQERGVHQAELDEDEFVRCVHCEHLVFVFPQQRKPTRDLTEPPEYAKLWACRRSLDSQSPLSPSPLTHYVVVRRDLPLGLLAAEVTHAAGESSPGNLPPGTNAVVLGVAPNELFMLLERLRDARIKHAAIIESAPPYDGQLMAIGIEPRPRNELRRFVSSYPLLGREEEP